MSGKDVAAVLSEGERRYELGDYRVATACADLATELLPHAAKAHHLYARSLHKTGRLMDAQVAFAAALAVAPESPVVLADAAAFYLQSDSRTNVRWLRLALAYTRKASVLAHSEAPSLRAKIFLLEATALNALGTPHLALPKAREALDLAPNLPDGRYVEALSLFGLLRLEESADILRQLSPDEGSGKQDYLLGRIYELMGEDRAAADCFERARKHSFSVPKELMTPSEFREEVLRLVHELPVELAVFLDDVELNTPDLPTIADLRAQKPPFVPTILGMFRVSDGAADPENPGTIFLYRKNLMRSATDREDLQQQIYRTLVHEVGHLRGFDEHQLRFLGLQ